TVGKAGCEMHKYRLLPGFLYQSIRIVRRGPVILLYITNRAEFPKAGHSIIFGMQYQYIISKDPVDHALVMMLHLAVVLPDKRGHDGYGIRSAHFFQVQH